MQKTGGRMMNYTQSRYQGCLQYRYSIENQSFNSPGDFFGLKSGVYRLAVLDAENCEWETVVEVGQPDSFGVKIVRSDSVSGAAQRSARALRPRARRSPARRERSLHPVRAR